MAIPSEFDPLIRALERVPGDLKANAPLPPPEPMTLAEALAGAQKLQAGATQLSTLLLAHPGVYWAALHVLTALAAMHAAAARTNATGAWARRLAWAPGWLDVLKAAPGALATATTQLPRLAGLLAAVQPAPRGGPPIAEADWSHGWPKPRLVDNPSGAIGGPL